MRDYGLEERLKGCRRCRSGSPCWRHMPGTVTVSAEERAAELCRRMEKVGSGIKGTTVDVDLDVYPPIGGLK